MYRQFPPGGGPPFGPPTGFPGGGMGPSGAQPMGPPPSFTPSQTQAQSFGGIGVQAVDPGAIRRCLYRFTYVWLDNGRSFWIFPVFVGRRSLAGYRWNGRRWVYFGIDLRRIDSFVCY
nr:hypothetical protein [Clostridium homopropionicum]